MKCHNAQIAESHLGTDHVWRYPAEMLLSQSRVGCIIHPGWPLILDGKMEVNVPCNRHAQSGPMPNP